MASLLPILKERYSCRKFTDQEVEEEKINAILEAGRIAPTAHNNQPVRVKVLKEAEALQLQEATPYMYHAHLAFVVCYDKSKEWIRPFDQMGSGVIDASIATTQMMLEITAQGLGSTWVGHFDPVKVKELLMLPTNIEPVAILPVGYKNQEPSHLHDTRNPIDHFLI